MEINMKKEEWNEGLNDLDPDIVEKYIKQKDKLRQKSKNSKGVWLRLGSIAACLALIVGTMIIIPTLREDDPGIIPNPDTTPVIFDATVSPEKLNGNSLEFIVGSSVSTGGGAGDSAPPKFQFGTGGYINVKAKVIKNHPDTYYKLDTSSKNRPTAYRLIQMETIEVIHGENVPQYFLYLIPEYLYVDMSVYDSLLISMSQLGFENYVLKNGTQSRMESFALTIFSDSSDLPQLGNIIAFSDDIFDESLWQNESWIYGYQFAKYYLDNPQYSNLVVARGDSESTVISAIKKYYNFIGVSVSSVRTLNFKTQAAKDAIEYVKPFVNGVFSQRWNNQLIFTRYINGCQTEETITIDLVTEEVTYSEIRYTKEEIAQMQDLSARIAEKASEYAKILPIPPHTDPDGKELKCLNLYAWYVKVDGKLYGVIKTSWQYLCMEKSNNIKYYVRYYDDAYVLYDMSAGTDTDISRDELVNIVGTRNVYMGEYGLGVILPTY